LRETNLAGQLRTTFLMNPVFLPLFKRHVSSCYYVIFPYVLFAAALLYGRRVFTALERRGKRKPFLGREMICMYDLYYSRVVIQPLLHNAVIH
jgi:hypothetical protein